MNADIEPWKITAYLLGELAEREADAVRLAIQSEPHLQREAASIRHVLGRVTEVLAKETNAIGLDATQRSQLPSGIASPAMVAANDETPLASASASAARPAVSQTPMGGLPSGSSRSWRTTWIGLAAMAASLGLAAMLIPNAIFPDRGSTATLEIASGAGRGGAKPSDTSLDQPSDKLAARPSGAATTVPVATDANATSLESSNADPGTVEGRVRVDNQLADAEAWMLDDAKRSPAEPQRLDSPIAESAPERAAAIAGPTAPILDKQMKEISEDHVAAGAIADSSEGTPSAAAGPAPAQLGLSLAAKPQAPGYAPSDTPPPAAMPESVVEYTQAVEQAGDATRGLAAAPTAGGQAFGGRRVQAAGGYAGAGGGFGAGAPLGYGGSGTSGQPPAGGVPTDNAQFRFSAGRGPGGPASSAPARPALDGLAYEDQSARAKDAYYFESEATALAPDAKATEIELAKQSLPEELRANVRRSRERVSGDRFDTVAETPFIRTQKDPLSTFSIDVDTASYSKLRQYVMQHGQLPQPGTVRIEELVNYFDYGYAGPTDDTPFASHLAMAACPWDESHRLVRIALQAKKVNLEDRPAANLVFLLDVSGSMDEPNKLPLVKRSIEMLVHQLTAKDRVAIVVYAGAAGCVLPSIAGNRQAEILTSLGDLMAGGSTNGGQGIQLAYDLAAQNFIPGGINRVLLCTDGDFNVGVTSDSALVELVKEKAKSKVFLTVLGFGQGNYNDAMMEQISNQGNGLYGMIDSEQEGRRMMVQQLAGTLMTVAKDVKIQVEFNPAKVAGYRLVGYENRRLAHADFNNDRKDAGDIGAGHRVTALYEIIPAGGQFPAPEVDELRYGGGSQTDEGAKPAATGVDATSLKPESQEWLAVKLRYKQPEGETSRKLEFYLTQPQADERGSDNDFVWASAVAEFGLLLRHSPLANQASWSRVLDRANASAGEDPLRREALSVMQRARQLSGW